MKQRVSNYFYGGIILIIFIIMITITGFTYPFQFDLTPSTNTESMLFTERQDESKGDSTEKVIYLTFDDGPSDYTEKIVDILDEYNVPATFFFIGKNVVGREEKVRYAAERGHRIGLHSMTHDRSIIYNEEEPDQFLNESLELQTYLEPLIGYKTSIIRPPYGSSFIPESIFNRVGEAGFKLWDWSIDTNDWREETTPDSIMTYLNDFPAGNREILLEHELPITLDVLPRIIEFYKKQGYTFKAYDPNEHFSYNFHSNSNY